MSLVYRVPPSGAGFVSLHGNFLCSEKLRHSWPSVNQVRCCLVTTKSSSFYLHKSVIDCDPFNRLQSQALVAFNCLQLQLKRSAQLVLLFSAQLFYTFNSCRLCFGYALCVGIERVCTYNTYVRKITLYLLFGACLPILHRIQFFRVPTRKDRVNLPN